MTETQIDKSNRQLIGWKEWVALPDLGPAPGVERIGAKIDTGAKSSALGASNICQRRKSGVSIVEFCLRLNRQGVETEYLCQAPYAGMRVIRSSNGQEEERVVIETRIGFGGRFWKIDLTLTNRDAMDFQLLVGRKALGRRFLVNPAASCLLGR